MVLQNGLIVDIEGVNKSGHPSRRKIISLIFSPTTKKPAHKMNDHHKIKRTTRLLPATRQTIIIKIKGERTWPILPKGRWDLEHSRRIEWERMT